MSLKLVALSVVMYVELSWCARTFPPGFKFGAASSSYQIEGAWNVSGKGESIWDRFCHEKARQVMGWATGDEACQSYYLWEEDIKIAEELGLHFYRFSLSWTRILPTGLITEINDDGVQYYNKLINGLLERGIQPVITLYHWDLPQRLQNLGGWANPYVADWFADYARVAYKLFGDRVKTWITINEPVLACDVAYNSGVFAPGVRDPEFANYICGKNLLLGHAKAWRIYDEEFKSKYRGRVGITNQLLWYEAEKEEDEELAVTIRQYMIGMYSHPIYSKTGGWPPELERIIAENSKKQGHVRSRLPPFTQEEIDLIKGTYDFYGLNYYTARVVRKAKENDTFGDWPLGDGAVEFNAVMSVRPGWIKESAAWFWTYAPGIRKTLVWLKKNYGDIEVFIAENGLSTSSDRLDDENRVSYLRNHLEQVWLAINHDGVNVSGYTVWSMMDNFEWVNGYDFKFGLYNVDINAQNRTRVARNSARYYAKVIRTHSMDVESKYNSGEIYSNLLFYTPLPIILVAFFVALFWCPKYTKMLTAEQRRLLNNTP